MNAANPLPASPPALALVREPHLARRLALVLVAALVLVPAAVCVTPWQQTARGQGRVIAFAPTDRQQLLEAPVEGRIARWFVREGSRVETGEPVFEIADNDPDLLVRLASERDAVQARLEAANTRANAMEGRRGALGDARGDAIAAAEARVRMALERVRGARQSLEAAEAAHKTARLNFERQSTLSMEGLASRRAYEVAELDEARTRADVERAGAALSAAAAEVRAFESDRSRVGNDTTAGLADARAAQAAAMGEAASAAAELARIEVRLARQASQYVTAPRAGTILRVVANQGGEFVKAGDTVAVLVPETESRAVELWIDGNDVPLVTEGRRVRLQFEGFPALQLSGWPEFATGTFGGEVAVVDPADDGTGRFRLLVAPRMDERWPPPTLLRQGLRATGWVLLETVPLGYELWRQFNGFPALVPAESKKLGGGGK